MSILAMAARNSWRGRAALLQAVQSKNADRVRKILGRGITAQRLPFNSAPIETAAIDGDVEITTILLKSLPMSKRAVEARRALAALASFRTNDARLPEKLLGGGLQPVARLLLDEITNKSSIAHLMPLASANGNFRLLRCLHAAGVDVNAMDHRGWTALDYACACSASHSSRKTASFLKSAGGRRRSETTGRKLGAGGAGGPPIRAGIYFSGTYTGEQRADHATRRIELERGLKRAVGLANVDLEHGSITLEEGNVLQDFGVVLKFAYSGPAEGALKAEDVLREHLSIESFKSD